MTFFAVFRAERAAPIRLNPTQLRFEGEKFTCPNCEALTALRLKHGSKCHACSARVVEFEVLAKEEPSVNQERAQALVEQVKQAVAAEVRR